jgi:hypothetical protein
VSTETRTGFHTLDHVLSQEDKVNTNNDINNEKLDTHNCEREGERERVERVERV